MFTQDRSNRSGGEIHSQADDRNMLVASTLPATVEAPEQTGDLSSTIRILEQIRPSKWTGSSTTEEAKITVQGKTSTLHLTYFKEKIGSACFEATLDGKDLTPEDAQKAFQTASELWENYSEPRRNEAFQRVGQLILDIIEDPSILDWQKSGKKFEATFAGMDVVLKPDGRKEAVLEISFEVPRHYTVFGIGQELRTTALYHGKATSAYDYLKAASHFHKTALA